MTYHPETHGINDYDNYLGIIIDAIKSWKINCIITKANADRYGLEINSIINKLTNQFDRFEIVDSLGIINYLSVVNNSQLVIGNSSSAIIEIPSLKVPVINIGDRQRGRIRHSNIIDVDYSFDEINKAYALINTVEFKNRINKMQSEFEGNNTSNEIIRTIETFFAFNKDSTKKVFYNKDEVITENE
jgi:UDP-N-acetylglucosamine 2-epimerase